MIILVDKGSGYLVHRDAAGECSQQEQQIEEAAEHIVEYRRVCKSCVEHIGQSDEHQSRTGIGHHARHAEHGGEDDETAQNSHQGVYRTHIESRRDQPGIAPEIGCVGYQTANAHTEREECLTHGTEHHTARNLAEVRTKQEGESGGRPWHRDGYCHQKQQYDEEQRHHEFGISLDAVSHTARHHKVGEQQEEIHIEQRPQRMG